MSNDKRIDGTVVNEGKAVDIKDASDNDWAREMAEFITPAVIENVKRQLGLCGKILASPVFQSVPFAVVALSDVALIDVSVNGEWLTKRCDTWRRTALDRLKDTGAGEMLERFEGRVASDFGPSEADQAHAEYVIKVMREQAACVLALGMLAGFEYCDRRVMSASGNLHRAVTDTGLVE